MVKRRKRAPRHQGRRPTICCHLPAPQLIRGESPTSSLLPQVRVQGNKSGDLLLGLDTT
ncbi:Hypothetical predicted protein, partial [Pelobates cultripes]